MATATMQVMEVSKTITAQDKWSQGDTYTRQQMLQSVGYPSSFASTSWKKLPYLLKVNLSSKTWTN